MMTELKLKNFFEFPFQHNQRITDKQLKAVYDEGHPFIHIILTDTHFSPEIILFNDNGLDEILGGVIHIENNSSKTTKVASGTTREPEPVRKNHYYSAVGNKDTGWLINIKPIN